MTLREAWEEFVYRTTEPPEREGESTFYPREIKCRGCGELKLSPSHYTDLGMTLCRRCAWQAFLAERSRLGKRAF